MNIWFFPHAVSNKVWLACNYLVGQCHLSLCDRRKTMIKILKNNDLQKRLEIYTTSQTRSNSRAKKMNQIFFFSGIKYFKMQTQKYLVILTSTSGIINVTNFSN